METMNYANAAGASLVGTRAPGRLNDLIAKLENLVASSSEMAKRLTDDADRICGTTPTEAQCDDPRTPSDGALGNVEALIRQAQRNVDAIAFTAGRISSL